MRIGDRSRTGRHVARSDLPRSPAIETVNPTRDAAIVAGMRDGPVVGVHDVSGCPERRIRLPRPCVDAANRSVALSRGTMGSNRVSVAQPNGPVTGDLLSGPVGTGERIELLDALRGFAVCGILFANIGYFSGYEYLDASTQATFPAAGLDRLIGFIEHTLIDGKFYSLFSLLFGLGFATQLQRASATGRTGTALFRRRLVGLLLIGLAHAYLLWMGDILSIYALVGFALIPFHRCRDRTVLCWAGGLLAWPVLQYALVLALVGGAEASGTIDSAQSEFDRLIAVFGSGSYVEVVVSNAQALLTGRYPNMLFTGRIPTLLGMFLIGLLLGRHGVLAEPGRHSVLLQRLATVGLTLGLLLNFARAVLQEGDAYYALQPLGLLQSALYAAGVLLLCLGYVAAFALLFQRETWRAAAMRFAPLGRMALSAYLTQTVVCVLVFYGYGLGWFFHVGRSAGWALAAAIVLAQLWAAPRWLARFRFGPAEWAWRSFTYRRIQSMRRAEQA